MTTSTMQLQDLIIDNFAGGGGASTGIEAATGRSPDYAINHCKHALYMHEQNHPETEHLVEDVWKVVPEDLVDGRGVTLAWFSPDCKHFSRAKGSKPVSGRIRGLAWTVVKWAKKVQPDRIFLENVPEFLDWGPVRDGQPIKSRKGEIFRRWVRNLRELGYEVEWKTLNAADYGVPTNRKRLFVIARCDGKPITWPEPTHGPGRANPHRTAAEIIDWSIPGRSIFGRKKPLVEKTMDRIANGLRRFVLEAGDDAFIIRTGHHSPKTGKGASFRGQRLDKPLGTVCAGTNDKALIVPWIAQYFGGVTGKPIAVPLPTITATDHNALAQLHLEDEVAARVDPDKVDEIRAFCIKYYGTAVGQRVTEPLHTVTTKARMGLVEIHGKDYQIVDITLRMLEPHELAAAQGFPEDYVLTGTKANKIQKIGNSVCPLLAEQIVRANP